MITQIEVINYRCLRNVTVPLSQFQVLVGANASGKTTFLDVFGFLKTLLNDGLVAAFEDRTPTPVDLLWNRRPGRIEIVLHAQPPNGSTIEYRLTVEVKSDTSGPTIVEEIVSVPEAPSPVLYSNAGIALFQSETRRLTGFEGTWPLGETKSALANLLPDETSYPASTWLLNLLKNGAQPVSLDNHKLRLASPPTRTGVAHPDGSNLPWIVRDLKQNHPEMFQAWLKHVAITLPGLEDIEVVIREDDRHAYLVVRYQQGLRVPSWLVSDGTLRLLALTVFAYLPSAFRLYMIEEPENGIHPAAVESIYQSLSSVYDGQVFVASHSPVLLSAAEPDQLLCFIRDADGASEILRGDQHPALRKWRNEVPLGAMFASGILG